MPSPRTAATAPSRHCLVSLELPCFVHCGQQTASHRQKRGSIDALSIAVTLADSIDVLPIATVGLQTIFRRITDLGARSQPILNLSVCLDQFVYTTFTHTITQLSRCLAICTKTFWSTRKTPSRFLPLSGLTSPKVAAHSRSHVPFSWPASAPEGGDTA